MEKTKELLKIRKKVQNFYKYIMEYGFNEEQDIFIKEEIKKMKNFLVEYQKEIENEEKLNN